MNDSSVDIASDLALMLEDLGPEELQAMVDEVDDDGSGVIEFDEFVQMIVLKMERAMMDDEKQVKKAFDVFDEEGTGQITTAALQTALGKRMGKSVTMEEARDMINAADKDGDGTVDFSEFVNFAASAH